MKATNLIVRKLDCGSLFLECEVLHFIGGIVRTVDYFDQHFKSADALQTQLGLTANRSVQRVGTSDRFARRIRAAKPGSVLLSVRWDGCERGSRPARAAIHAYVEICVREFDQDGITYESWVATPVGYTGAGPNSADGSAGGNN